MLEGQGQYVVVFQSEFDSEEMVCVWGYDPDDGAWEPSTNRAHDAWNAFDAQTHDFMTNQYHLIRVEMQLAVPGGVMTSAWAEDHEGANAQDAVPQNTAYLIHKRTNGVGAGKNGRCYIPGVSESKVDAGGRLLDVWADSVSDQMNLLLPFFDGEDRPFLVVNRGLRVDPTDPPPRVPTIVPDPLFWKIETQDCDSTVGTQRRRLRR